MLLVDQHGISERTGFLSSLNGVFWQIGFGRHIFQWIDPRTGIFGSAGILRYGNDFKILIFQLLVDCLPAWQVKAAPSPTGPRNQQDFLPAKIGEPMQLSLQVRQREIRRFQ